MLDSIIAIHPRDPHVTDRSDRLRLSAQCVRIIALFQKRGRVSNRELAAISLKYTSRISDLRDAGYLVVCTHDDATAGLCWYSLRDLRMDPRAGYSLTSQFERREIVAVRTDGKRRRWVLYRTPSRMGVTRVLLGTWREWASAVPTGRRKRSAFQWRRRERLAINALVGSPSPRRKVHA
jgi:hypothetical protein